MGKQLVGRSRRNNHSHLGNAGQVAIESILLMTLSLGILFAASRLMKEREVMKNLVHGPTEKLSGMVESGTWAPADEAKKNHPNLINRSLTVKPGN